MIGAGIAGLVAALELARRGLDVTVVERQLRPGGKLRTVSPGARAIDCGPTVLTMRHVFEAIFAAAGASLETLVPMQRASILARHAWSATERLDLFADIDRSADAIAAFSSPAEAMRYRQFCARARGIFETLDATFMQAPRPSMLGLVGAVGLTQLPALAQIKSFSTLWTELGRYFHDPRLRQLFGRYATYCGSSPFEAPATLMLIAHAEQSGVWLVDGGMHRLADALATLAQQRGATFRYGCDAREVLVARDGRCGVVLDTGERIDARAVVFNGDTGAIADGRFGQAIAGAVPRPPRASRSLSAVTFALEAEASGFPLSRHNVFFSKDYPAEFRDIASGRVPSDPTVYVCAQDRGDAAPATSIGPERLFCIVNAPANGDNAVMSAQEIEQCRERTFRQLERCGLSIRTSSVAISITTPSDFEQLFPSTGGALYGQATHGWRASFQRPGSRATLTGLYLAGGSVHPGAGVPMAAISGRLAAAALMADLGSTRRSHRVAMPGGTLTR